MELDQVLAIIVNCVIGLMKYIRVELAQVFTCAGWLVVEEGKVKDRPRPTLCRGLIAIRVRRLFGLGDFSLQSRTGPC